MKKLLYIFAALVPMFSACEYDNYAPPKSRLTGRIVYEDTPVPIRKGLDVLQLYELGWQLSEPINVNVKQDGSFTSLLFEGDYKLVRIKGQGPWVSNTDTIDIKVKGTETTIDVSVKPFFIIREENFQVNGSTLKATFSIEKVVQEAEIKQVSLYIGETNLVDNLYNIRQSSISGKKAGDLSEKISLEVDVSDISKSHVFARIGVRTVGSSEYIFTPVQKIAR